MPRTLLLLALLACVAMTSGCGLLKGKLFARKHSKDKSDKASDMFVGVVESVNPEQKFVLVRTDQRIVITAGTKLETRALNGTKASLLVTPERKMNFLSADIVEGSPVAGDIVIIPSADVAAATATTVPAMPVVPELHPAPGIPLPGAAPLPLPAP